MALLASDDDALGLEIIWPGHPTSKITADIVAVHGLAGGSSSTYRHEDGTSFLADLLPRDPEIPALPNFRILSFGYAGDDAYYTSGTHGGGRIMTFAEQLCYDLRNARADLVEREGHRPIIFIGHGIGGLVVKKAVTDNDDIRQCTTNIMFFDTPHQGFDCQGWMTLKGCTMNEDAKVQFHLNSTSLSELNRAFLGAVGTLTHFSIATFYCCRPVVIDADQTWSILEGSAVLGVDNESRCPVDRVDHMRMLKYGAFSDSVYKRVKGYLRSALLRLPSLNLEDQVVAKRKTWGVQKYNGISSRLLRWLSLYRHEYNQQRLSAMRCPGTTDWILKDESFLGWHKSTQSCVLWCSGNVGTGKTIICSRIVRDLITSFSLASDVAVIYVYCQYDEPATITSARLITSFIKQLLLRQETFGVSKSTQIREKLERAWRRGGTQLDAEESFDILVNLAQTFFRVFVLIDGLDECNSNPQVGKGDYEEAGNILRSVNRWLQRSNSSVIKFLLSSRYEINIRRYVPDCFHVDLSQSNVDIDIQNFVQDEVEDKLWVTGRIEDYGLVQEIKQKLFFEAHGMILWAKLQVQALCQDCNSQPEIRKALDKLPPSLQETYHRCLLRAIRRRGNLNCAPTVLKWMCAAKRPLLIDELKEATSVKPGYTKWDDLTSPISSTTLVNSCGGLVYLDEIDQTVRLVHPSAKTYLFSSKPADTADASTLDQFNLSEAAIDMALGEACLVYLGFNDFTRQLARREERIVTHKTLLPNPHEILEAVDPWTKRVTKVLVKSRSRSPRKSMEHITRQPFLPDIVTKQYKLLEYARSFWASHSTTIQPTSPLFLGFKRLVVEPNSAWRLQPWLGDDGTRLYSDTVFDWAVNNDHVPILRLLPAMDRASSPSYLPARIMGNSRFAIHHAAAEGLQHVLTFFTTFAGSPLCKDSNSWTALHYAASKGQLATATILLQNSPGSSSPGERKVSTRYIDLLTSEGRTALYQAVEFGNSSLVRLLLENGASKVAHEKIRSHNTFIKGFSSRAQNHLTVLGSLLTVAAENNCSLVAQELLNSGSDEHELAIALYTAVHRYHVEVAKTIIRWSSTNNHNCDPDDKSLRRAVEWANDNKVDMLRFILLSRTDEQLCRWITEPILTQLVEKNQSSALNVVLEFKGRVLASEQYINLWNHRLLMAAAKKDDASKAIFEVLQSHSADILGGKKSSALNDPLWRAVSLGNVATATILLDLGADKTMTSQEITLAGLALIKEDVPMLRMLLQQGADVNQDSSFPVAGSSEKSSLLRRALCTEHLGIIETLLQYGARVSGKDETQAPPLTFAIEQGRPELVKILLDYGANPNHEAVLDALYQESKSESVVALANFTDIMHLLRLHGHDINTDAKGQNSLRQTVKQLNAYKVIFLLKNGAKINAVEANGESVLFEAARLGSVLICANLVSYGATVNLRSRNGQTPLDVAVDKEIISVLRGAGGHTATELDQQWKWTVLKFFWICFSGLGFFTAVSDWGGWGGITLLAFGLTMVFSKEESLRGFAGLFFGLLCLVAIVEYIVMFFRNLF